MRRTLRRVRSVRRQKKYYWAPAVFSAACRLMRVSRRRRRRSPRADIKKEFDKKYGPTWHVIVGRCVVAAARNRARCCGPPPPRAHRFAWRCLLLPPPHARHARVFSFFFLAAARRLQQLWLVRDARDEALYLLLPRAGSHPLLQERLNRRKERSSSAGRARSPAHFRPLGASPPPSAPRHPLPHIVHVPPLARHAARRPRSAPRSLSHAGVSLNKLAKPLPLTVAVKE